MKKAIQYFSKESLETGRAASPMAILQFLEDFRNLHGQSQEGKSKLISIKVPESLLNAFRAKADQESIPYQTQIKNLMRQWLSL